MVHALGHLCKQKMAGMLTRQYYIRKSTTLENSNKLCTIFFVVSTLHIALIGGSI